MQFGKPFSTLTKKLGTLHGKKKVCGVWVIDTLDGTSTLKPIPYRLVCTGCKKLLHGSEDVI